MKKTTLFTFLSLFLTFQVYAQTFTAGWYIIKSNATYTVLLPSGEDVRKQSAFEEIRYDEEGYPIYNEPPKLEMNAGEVVLVFEQNREYYYAFDPHGRMLAVKGANSLEKAPNAPNAGVGLLMTEVELISGETLKGFYWIVGQDVAKSTITIQIEGGKQYNIPKENVVLFSTGLRKHVKETYFETVK
jgi:hypothetical protein